MLRNVLQPTRRHLVITALSAPLWPSSFRRAFSASILDAGAFSPPAAAGEDGSGPDSTDALQIFCNELARGNYHVGRIPPGRYRLTRPLMLLSTGFRDLTIEAAGVEFVFDMPKPELHRGYFRIGNPARTGERLMLTGLTARLARPAIRTSNSDMIRLSGFQHYAVSGIAIPSADNMALAIGRGDPLGWTPRSIVVEESTFGGRREDLPHSHGSIGDTAVWIVTPAETTRVSGCRIQETGDDAIYVGHSNSRSIRSVVIRDNTLSNTCGGIGVAVPHAEIVGNRINRTNVCAIRCEAQNGNQGSDAYIANNVIKSAGQLEEGDISSEMIQKVHPHGIFIYEPFGRVCIEDNYIEGARECAIVLHPHKDAPLSGISIYRGTYKKIGVDRDGRSQTPNGKMGVFRRSPNASQSVSGFHADAPEIIECRLPLLSWSRSGAEYDDDIAVTDAQLIDCDLSSSSLVQCDARQPAAGMSMRISYTTTRSTIVSELSAARLSSTEGIKITRNAVTR